MTRFYFDVDDGLSFVQDDIGLEIGGTKLAKAEVLRALCDIAKEQAVEQENQFVRILIRGTGTAAIWEASLQITCKPLHRGSYRS